MNRKTGRAMQVLAAIGVAIALTPASGPAFGQWSFAGQNAQNTRYNASESTIGVGNVNRLRTKWVYTTDGDVSATPTVLDDSVYIVDFGGSIHRISRNTGTNVWKVNVNTLIPTTSPGLPPNRSRTSLAVAGSNNNKYGTKFNDGLIFGTQSGAWVASVSKVDGHLLWKTQLDAHPFAIVTQSPVVQGNRVYVGVASTEENYATFIPGYPCCSSRGSVAALDVNTGHIVWQTYTIPSNRIAAGFSGAGVWGSTVAVDTDRNSLYVTTGNNYSAPASVRQCVVDSGENIAAISGCTPADVNFDSVIALDLDTGATKWARRFWSYDAWNVGCIGLPGSNPAVCPTPAGPDFDFAQGASLYTIHTGNGNGKGKSYDLVGVGQKSGYYWALNPDTGAVVWSHQVGPGSSLGGLEWGSAVDGTRVYTALVNLYHIPYSLQPTGGSASAGGWAAMDAATGAPLWQVADPAGSMGLGPITGANGVVFACSMDPANGHAYAFNAASGAILWSFVTGASCNNGPAIADGVVYWGTGYGVLGPGLGTPNNKLYAFSIN